MDLVTGWWLVEYLDNGLLFWMPELIPENRGMRVTRKLVGQALFRIRSRQNTAREREGTYPDNNFKNDSDFEAWAKDTHHRDTTLRLAHVEPMRPPKGKIKSINRNRTQSASTMSEPIRCCPSRVLLYARLHSDTISFNCYVSYL